MKKNAIFFLTVIIFIVISSVLFAEEREQKAIETEMYLAEHSVFESIYFVSDGMNMGDIRLIPKDEDLYHAYMPLSAETEVEICFDYCDYMLLDNQKISTGDSLPKLKKGNIYTLQAIDDDKVIGECEIVFYFQGTIPALYVTTESGNMDSVNENPECKENASYVLYTEEGVMDAFGNCNIKGRGNTSWNKTQKPYNLNLDSEISLLGMERGKEWALLANYGERMPQLKNKIAYELAKELDMPYTSECEFVNLYLNGYYNGLYLLTERVNVPSAEYLLEFDARYREEPVYFETEKQDIVVKIPQESSEEQLKYIRGLVAEAEKAIYNEDGINPDTGKHYTEYIDVDSWVKMYILQDFMVQYDVEYASFFFYKKNNDSRLYAGPIWDFDLSCGVFYIGNYPELAKNVLWIKDVRGEWGTELISHDDFKSLMKEKFLNEISPSMSKFFEEEYWNIVAPLDSAIEMQAVRWNKSGQNEEALIYSLYEWLSERNEFLNEYYIKPDDYYSVIFEFSFGEVPYYIKKESALGFLPCDKDRKENIVGWINEDGIEMDELTLINDNVKCHPIYEE